MPTILDTRDSTFDEEFEAFLNRSRDSDDPVSETVTSIIDDVRRNGDQALIEYTRRLDDLELTPATLAFSADEIDAAVEQVSPEERDAVQFAFDRIMAFHQRQLPQDQRWTDEAEAEIGWKWTPIRRVGVYVPGGTASYPSSVLMNAVPALVAGVDEIVMAAPIPGGNVNPLVIYAAQHCSIKSIYKIGGAQAIAALAYGTETIDSVDKIIGPGNAYVANAKRRVFGQVGIDLIAGPSEILIIADADNDPDWVAIDLLSQAEHDELAQAILVTPDRGFGEAVIASLSRQLASLSRKTIAAESWEANGGLIVVRDLQEAVAVSDRIAPEHLSIMTSNPNDVARDIRHAGAIFLGRWTPEAIGDYVAGPSHVLPTSGNARFSSGLSVLDFMKRTTITRMSPGSLERIGPAATTLARSEALQAHELSVQVRLDRIASRKNG